VEQTVARDADVGDELDLGARLQVHLLGRGQWNSLKSSKITLTCVHRPSSISSSTSANEPPISAKGT